MRQRSVCHYRTLRQKRPTRLKLAMRWKLVALSSESADSMAMMTGVSELLRRYQQLFTVAPDWAYQLNPSIPFIGKNYSTSTLRIAVYASSENLTHYERGDAKPSFFQGDGTWNRHRLAHESGSIRFFPSVHIAPVGNGSLLCAVLYLLQKHLGGPLPSTPDELLERLVVANVGKFSITTGGKTVRDYAGDPKRIANSLPYFRADLEVLRPTLLILPRTIYKQSAVRRLISKVLPDTKVLPIPQFNAKVVNIHLARHASRAAALAQQLQGSAIASWTDHLTGYTPGHPYRFYVALDDVVASSRDKLLS